MELSVIVVCRDNPAQLLQTLLSLESAGMPPSSEVLIVDGSADLSCQEVVQNWSLTCVHSWRIRRVWLAPRGVYSAFNFAVQVASASWLAFMNSGDAYLPGGVALLIQAAREHPGPRPLRAVMAQALVCCPGGRLSWLTPDPAMLRPERWLRRMLPCHQALLFERSFARANPYPEDAGAYGDRVVMRSALSEPGAFVYVKRPVCSHVLDGFSSAPLSFGEFGRLWRSGALVGSDRLALLFKFFLAPLWRWRPCWMLIRSRLMGYLC